MIELAAGAACPLIYLTALVIVPALIHRDRRRKP